MLSIGHMLVSPWKDSLGHPSFPPLLYRMDDQTAHLPASCWSDVVDAKLLDEGYVKTAYCFILSRIQEHEQGYEPESAMDSVWKGSIEYGHACCVTALSALSLLKPSLACWH